MKEQLDIFLLVYGTEGILPLEVKLPTLRMANASHLSLK